MFVRVNVGLGADEDGMKNDGRKGRVYIAVVLVVGLTRARQDRQCLCQSIIVAIKKCDPCDNGGHATNNDFVLLLCPIELWPRKCRTQAREGGPVQRFGSGLTLESLAMRVLVASSKTCCLLGACQSLWVFGSQFQRF